MPLTRLTNEEVARLRKMGCHAFAELTEQQNDTVFRARLLGYAAFFPCVPDASAQANKTLAGAIAFLNRRHAALLGGPVIRTADSAGGPS